MVAKKKPIVKETKQADKETKQGCIALIVIAIVICCIIKCYTSSDGYQPINISSSDVITEEDSRIEYDLPNEHPDKLDLFVDCQYFVSDHLSIPESAELDLASFSVQYLVKEKIYLCTGIVSFTNAYNAPLKRTYAIGLQYKGGKANVRRSWIEESFAWVN